MLILAPVGLHAERKAKSNAKGRPTSGPNSRAIASRTESDHGVQVLNSGAEGDDDLYEGMQLIDQFFLTLLFLCLLLSSITISEHLQQVLLFEIAEEEEEEEEGCATSPEKGQAGPSRQPAQLGGQPAEAQDVDGLQRWLEEIPMPSIEQLNMQGPQIDIAAGGGNVGEKDAEAARPPAAAAAAAAAAAEAVAERSERANMPINNPVTGNTAAAAVPFAGIDASQMIQPPATAEAATAAVSNGAGPSAPAGKTSRSGRERK